MGYRLLVFIFTLFPLTAAAETPTLQQTVERAVRHAGLAGPDDRWSARSRWSALLPEIDVAVGQQRDDDFRTKEKSNFFRDDSEALLHEWTQSEVARNLDEQIEWRVTASWDLSDLIFNTNELQAESRAAARRRLRLEVEERVSVLFMQWTFLRKRTQSPEQLLERFTYAAKLNAATGGWFLQETQP